MRLDDYDPNSVDVVDQRGSNMGMGARGGQIGCGTIIIALLAAYFLGVDPTQMLGGGASVDQQQIDQGGQVGDAGQQGGTSTAESCAVNQYSHEACNVLSSLNKTWEPIFRQANIEFKRPKMVFYSRLGQSGCGAAQSAMGPFYCPSDGGIYIDTQFYDEMEQRMGAGGDFARAYVVAHEYGHHVQTITGISDQIRSAQSQNPRAANQLQVRMELQADCYAGVWASKNRDKIEPGDMEEGLTAAHSIGDDTLMEQAGRRPVESAFTHGSSEQRVAALRRGMQGADDTVCDAYMQ